MANPGDCKDAILAITEAIGLTAVDHRWTPPTEGEDYPTQEPEATYFGDTEIVDDDWAELGANAGRGTRMETFRVTVTILVVQTGDDARPPEVRMWAIRDAIQNAMRTDLFSGPSSLLRQAGVLQFGQITGLASTGVWGPSQWASRFDGRITFQSRTT